MWISAQRNIIIIANLPNLNSFFLSCPDKSAWVNQGESTWLGEEGERVEHGHVQVHRKRIFSQSLQSGNYTQASIHNLFVPGKKVCTRQIWAYLPFIPMYFGNMYSCIWNMSYYFFKYFCILWKNTGWLLQCYIGL